MNLISRDELKEKIDRGDEFKLVMTHSDWGFKAKHIPGSLNLSQANQAAELLDLTDEIVIYCSDEKCAASRFAFEQLISAGYKNVRRYAGGIDDWEANGLPLEGEWAQE